MKAPRSLLSLRSNGYSRDSNAGANSSRAKDLNVLVERWTVAKCSQYPVPFERRSCSEYRIESLRTKLVFMPLTEHELVSSQRA